MTTSAFAAIQATLLGALNTAPALASGHVYANRARAIPAGQDSAIVLRITAAHANQEIIGSLNWETTFACECFARTTAGTDPAATVDTLLQAVWARLGALTDAALGASIDVNPAITWQYDDADGPYVCASFAITAMHTPPSTALTPSP